MRYQANKRVNELLELNEEFGHGGMSMVAACVRVWVFCIKGINVINAYSLRCVVCISITMMRQRER